MTDDTNFKPGTLERFTGRRVAGGAATGPRFAAAPEKAQVKIDEVSFPGEFARLKASVIRPVFEAIGKTLTARGDEFNVSEEAGGRISIHIVPEGAKKSIHPYDWFPTLTFFGTPMAGTIGLHGRNMRPNTEVTSGSRATYAPAQINKDLVEKELMKFIGEIANW